jgi:hypothetical protein
LTCLDIALHKVLIGYAFHPFEPGIKNYFKRKSVVDLPPPTLENDKSNQVPSILKKSHVVVSFAPADLGLQSPLSSYHPTDWDEIRRMYLQKGSCLVSLMTINLLGILCFAI